MKSKGEVFPMLLNCDKYFIMELQKNGFDIDYKKLTEIYRESRKYPGVQKRKRENAAINAAMFETPRKKL